ncbi:DNA-binding CsgD family transcriptional regulator [Thermocatellispora tengchongensis]|uniref:DNA-binding CsgD family transcriptional regulator n=1 Tax=Thermocatellispora tengchongensis TaxID=1073253 RepID=A0A840P824_9ACTN|nr:DNA-binding CsgD family transcriptional regulator [Thermocatellispora tengchongensis]
MLTATASQADHKLPLEVVNQLFSALPAGREDRAELDLLLRKGAVAAMWSELETETVPQMWAQIMQRLWGVVLRAAMEAPVLIAVDDAHYADAPSSQCLLYFARRLRSSSVRLVLTELESRTPAHPCVDPEFLRLPHCDRVRLSPLSERGVAALLQERPGSRLSRACHDLTGGNPLLVHALMADQRGSPAAGQAEGQSAPPLVLGEEFSQAVLSCLHRGGEDMLELARGMAILGPAATPELLAELLGMNPAHVPLVMRALRGTGLLRGDAFRHPHIRATIVNALGQDHRSGLHVQAAQLLHESGAEATTVAEHLVLAGVADLPWMPEVLEEAARHALAEDRVKFAISCLELARRASDESERLRLTVSLAVAEWRHNASRAVRHLPELAAGVRARRLTGDTLVTTMKFLLWYGRVDDAAAALSEVSGQEEALRQWLACSHPSLLDKAAKEPPAPRHMVPATAAGLEAEATTALFTVLAEGGSEEAISQAETVLESSRLDETTMEPITSSLLALIYADRVEKAGHWCRILLDEAISRRAPSWQAMLTAIDAEIALRRGALPRAERSADAALSQLSAAGWGVWVALPLSSLLQSVIAMGKLDKASCRLSQPVPEAMFRSRFGLQYLYARGQYFLATERFRAALNDFTRCGALMTDWRLDLPEFIPWRTKAAVAHIEMGHYEQARRLISEQLKLLGPGRSRARGHSLRLLAATSELRKRPGLLKEAIDVLQASGDRLELAWALTDLSQAQRALGEAGRAQMTARIASQVAEDCGAKPLLAAQAHGHRDRPRDDAQPAVPSGDGGAENGNGAAHGIRTLSDAERRVAALAARGDTNHEIARSLFITVSTVEQHLTRVYRKLNVSGRTELPTELCVMAMGPGQSGGVPMPGPAPDDATPAGPALRRDLEACP